MRTIGCRCIRANIRMAFARVAPAEPAYICADAARTRHVRGRIPQTRSRRNRLDRGLSGKSRSMGCSAESRTGRHPWITFRLAPGESGGNWRNPGRLPEDHRSGHDALESSGIPRVLREFCDRRRSPWRSPRIRLERQRDAMAYWTRGNRARVADPRLAAPDDGPARRLA